MMPENISDLLLGVTSKQEEAVANIKAAKSLGVDPITYKEYKGTLNEEVTKQQVPVTAMPVTAKTMRESPEHAAAIAPDAEKMGFFERLFNSYGKEMKARSAAAKEAVDYSKRQAGLIASTTKRTLGPERELSDLGWKKLRDGGPGAEKFTEDDDFRLRALRVAKKKNFGEEDYGLTGFFETLPAETIAQTADIGNVLWRNKGTIATIVGGATAAGAAAGGAVTAPFGGGGALPGAQSAFRASLMPAWMFVSFKDSYQKVAGTIYDELDTAADETGKPLNIDENTKKYIAHGVGILSGSVSAIVDKKMLQKLPLMKRLTSPKEIAEIATKSQHSLLRQSLVAIGQVMAMNSTEEGLQEIVELAGTEIGNTYDGSEVSVINGIANAAKKIQSDPETQKRIAKAATVGGLVAGGMAAGSVAVDVGTQTVKINQEITAAEAENKKAVERHNKKVKQARQDVILETADKTRILPETVRQAFPQTDIVNLTPYDAQAVEALEFEAALDVADKLTQDTKLNQLAPEILVDMQAKAIEENTGIKEVWVEQEALEQASSAERARALVDRSGTAARLVNGQVRMSTHEFLEFRKEFPTISEHAKLNPAAPTPSDSRAFAEKLQEQRKKREELQFKMGTYEKSAEERAYAVKVTPDIDDESLKLALGSKEVADAYLGRLDVNEAAVKEEAQRVVPLVRKETSPEPKDPNAIYLSDLAEMDEKFDYNKIKSSQDALKRQVQAQRVFRKNPQTEEEFIKAAESSGAKNPEEFGKFLWGLRQRALNEEQGGSQEAYAKYFGVEFIEGESMNDLDTRISEKQVQDLLQEQKDARASIEAREKQKERSKPITEAEKKLAEIQAMRERVTALRDTLPDDVSAKEVIRQALEQPEPNTDVANEAEYLNQPVFTRAIKERLSEAEVAQVETAQRNARMTIVEQIRESSKWEMDQVIDVVEEIGIEVQHEIEMERLKADPNIKVVDDFVFSKDDKGRPTYAINFNTLSKNDQKKYADNPLMKKHKVFVKKGGLTADEAARLVGAGTGETLLTILSTTDTLQNAVDAAVEKSRPGIRAKAEAEAVEFETALKAAYGNNTRNHLQELRYMLREEWAGKKKEIKRIALPLPKIEELRQKARNAIEQTKVADLKPNLFKVAERKSNRLALDAVLKNEEIKAFTHKEQAALASELTLAAHIAVGRVNRAIRFAKSFDSKEIQAVLKRAGQIYVDAADQILDVYNLSPERKGDYEDTVAYQKYVEEQIKAGNGNFDIPERFRDVRASMNDMTVEEILVATDRLRTILHQAKMKNQLYVKHSKLKEVRHLGELAEKFEQGAVKHPDYDENRSQSSQGAKKPTESIANVLNSGLTVLKGAEHILQKVDNDQIGGLITEAVAAKLMGNGEYSDMGHAGKAKDMIALGKAFQEIIDFIDQGATRTDTMKRLGLGEFSMMDNEVIEVEELKGNKKLNNGRVTKGQLFMMMLNRGNEGNLDRLTQNFGITEEQVNTILDKHLDEKYAVAAQRILDLAASYWPRVKALQKLTTGVEPEAVEAKPFTHKGKVYPGGWWHIRYNNDLSYEKIKKRAKDITHLTESERMQAQADGYYTNDMTRHGHTERRVGSDQMLSLDMHTIGQTFEMIIHDLNYRVPIADSLKVLLHPKIAKNFINITGIQDYTNVINTVTRLSHSLEMKNAALYFSNKLDDMAVSTMRRTVSVGMLAYNVGSIFVQPVSMVYAVEQMGVTAPKHMLNALTAMRSMTNIQELYDFASEINPAISQYREGFDDNTRDAISRALRKQNFIHAAEPAFIIADKVNDFAFTLLGIPDQAQKVLIALSGYAQFMAGDVKGFDLDKLATMTDQEKDHQAKVYAASLSRLTLTSGSEWDRAEVQKKFPLLTMFFNDVRNMLNNSMRQGRKVKQGVKQRNITKAASGVAALWVTLFTISAMEDLLRRSAKRLSDEEAFDEFDLTKHAATAPLKVLGFLPGARDIAYGLQREGFNGMTPDVLPIPAKMLNDVYRAAEMGLIYMDLKEDQDEPGYKHKQGALYTASLMTGGRIPVNIIMKGLKALEDYEENSDPPTTTALHEEYEERLKAFKKKQAESEPEERVSDDIVKELEEIGKKIKPKDAGALVPEGVIETIKAIESGGDPYAKNPNSSAYGLYQFTSGTWRDIMDKAPELGLTEEGRVEDVEEQERAMEWFTQRNAEKLFAADIEVSVENLYAAHFLGAEKAIQVLAVPADTKMKLLVSDNVMAANDFKNSMRVKDFKSWVSRKVSSASRDVAALDNE